MTESSLAAFARRFIEEAPALADIIHAAYQAGVLDQNPDLSGNGEDVFSELVEQAEEALKESDCG